MCQQCLPRPVTRRAWLACCLSWLGPLPIAGATSAALARPAAAPDALPNQRPRSLWITRPQAQESLQEVFWADGRLCTPGYAAIVHLYRDLYENRSHPIHLGLLNLNFAIQHAVALYWSPRPMVLLSGFRTPLTNRRVGGVEPSVHGTGQADDYRYEGIALADSFRLARAFQVGGLGLYPDQNSLHKDVAPLRSWVSHRQPQAQAPAVHRRAPVTANGQPCATCTN